MGKMISEVESDDSVASFYVLISIFKQSKRFCHILQKSRSENDWLADWLTVWLTTKPTTLSGEE